MPAHTPKTHGRVGEQLAEIWFRQNGWRMERHQPSTIIVRIKGKPITIQRRSQGVSDYTGYEYITLFEGWFPMYRAVEVKEAHGLRMPASRLDVEQRDWMAAIDRRCAFVGVCWMDNPIEFELFKFINSGSYVRGQGIKDASVRL